MPSRAMSRHSFSVLARRDTATVWSISRISTGLPVIARTAVRQVSIEVPHASSSSAMSYGRMTTASISLSTPASPLANDPKMMTLTGGIGCA